ncbi:MAG: DUF1349 domain-containing protein, partial [bacterium]|nr:DUF1349 domain-containing protein [bacterium]
FDTYSTGSSLKVFAAVTVDGNSTTQINLTVPGNTQYLRVSRSGDDWTFEYSNDGVNWTTAGSFTHAMTVTSAGVFAGNTGDADGFTAQVDYFENTASPLTTEDGNPVPVNEAPVAVDDALGTNADEVLIINVAADLLNNDTDANGNTLSLAGFTQPSHGTLIDNGDGMLTYTPTQGYEGDDSFTYDVSDGEFTDTATVLLTVSPPPPPPAPAQSDDFSSGVLDPVWTIEGPAGTSAGLATTVDDAFLLLETPDGSHDVWGTNNGARAMQTVVDEDFQLETRFLTTPTEQYQMQGLLVEQDANNWIRFDTYSDGTNLRAFAAVTVNGNSTARFNVVVPADSQYLRVTRADDDWTLEYSSDGVNWTAAGSFTHA